MSAAFSEVWGVGCCVCLGGELPLVWFPLPLPKLVSLTVKNPSQGLSFYSAPCENKLINMALLGIMTQKLVIFCLFSPEILEGYIFFFKQKNYFQVLMNQCKRSAFTKVSLLSELFFKD